MNRCIKNFIFMILLGIFIIAWNIQYFYEHYERYQISVEKQDQLNLKLKQIQQENFENKKVMPIFKILNQKHVINLNTKSDFYAILEHELSNAKLNLKQINISPVIKSKDAKSVLSSIDYTVEGFATNEEQILLFIKLLNEQHHFVFNIEKIEIKRVENQQIALGNLELKCFIKLYTYFLL